MFNGELIKGTDPHQRQTLIGEKVHLRLIGDSQIRLTAATRRGGRAGSGRRDDLNVQSLRFKGANLFRHHNRRHGPGLMYQSSTRVSFSLAIACPLISAVNVMAGEKRVYA
ncbi:Uncharacterised protein [Raoultella planticola]|uniref:Uncharacterized protein n=1 Tax=Raoultella planticola TaxID=575 RepID=A0A485CVR5_RAOPL|nr:Uncharacterised protein [Raoultella planticola]